MTNEPIEKIKFIETTFVPSEEENGFLDHVQSAYMPWYLHKSMLYEGSDEAPFLAHTLRSRASEVNPLVGDPNSGLIDIAESLFHKIAKNAGVKVDQVLRSAFNLTFHSNFTSSGKHVDHKFPHNNFLLYLNDCTNGETIIYSNDKIAKEVAPVKNKAVFFGGELHEHRFCGDGEYRIVMVVTFLGKIPRKAQKND